jgi:putative sigma-54 modulation protein
MKVNYTGKLYRLTPSEERRLASRFAKLGKLLDGKSEKEAHVILKKERRSEHAEVTVNYYDTPLAGEGEAGDQLAALTNALDKLEKQLLRKRAKWRDAKRRAGDTVTTPESGADAGAAAPVPRINRVTGRGRKPMTLDEALLVIGRRNYLAYRDAETSKTSVLIRRDDGGFDLVEG